MPPLNADPEQPLDADSEQQILNNPFAAFCPLSPQILNNLVGNSAKFTRAGFIRVIGRHTPDGRMVAVSVLDTGIGIPRHKLDTIFQPFEQVRPGFGWTFVVDLTGCAATRP